MSDQKKWKVFYVAYRPGREDVIRSLEEVGCEVILGREFKSNKFFTEDEMVARVPEMDALLVTTGEPTTRRIMEAGKKLRIISKQGIGVEQIDVKSATELGIMVTNTPTELNVYSTAEYAVAMILAAAKKHKLADYNARHGLYRSVNSTLLFKKTIGIIGLGRIGSRVAHLLTPFGVRFLAYDPYVSADKASAIGVKLVSLEELLKESDVVTMHAVQTAENMGLIGEAQLRLMKPTAYLVNTSRGGMINEAALTKALKEGWIAGAALDVFETEVPGPDNPLLDEDLYLKTQYSPHVAGFNPDNEREIPTVQAQNCIAALRGEIPKHVVNPQVIPRWRERMKRLDECG